MQNEKENYSIVEITKYFGLAYMLDYSYEYIKNVNIEIFKSMNI